MHKLFKVAAVAVAIVFTISGSASARVRPKCDDPIKAQMVPATGYQMTAILLPDEAIELPPGKHSVHFTFEVHIEPAAARKDVNNFVRRVQKCVYDEKHIVTWVTAGAVNKPYNGKQYWIVPLPLPDEAIGKTFVGIEIAPTPTSALIRYNNRSTWKIEEKGDEKLALTILIPE